MSHPASPESVFRFGVFELDTRTGELRKAGVKLKIPEQSVQILATLLERPGELVTREESGRSFGRTIRSWSSTTASTRR
jgi:DNA-binding response OmpR family regulator